MKYDFLVAGFPKCGTTTLHNLMQQNPQVYLPECKETFYFSKNELYKKKDGYFEKTFYNNVSPGQALGGVEPSFSRYARRVEPYLDENTKIIFLVRNPLDYLFSFYKMCMSFGIWAWYDAYRKRKSFSGIVRANIKLKNNSYQIGKSNHLIRAAIMEGKYIESIRNYEKIVGNNNIKIVLFEEFIKDEERVVNDIFKYIGVKEREVRSDINRNRSEELMPSSYLGMNLLAKREYLHNTYMEHRKEINKAGMALCSLYYKYVPYFAAKSIKEEIDDSAKKILHGYYKESVMELAEFTKMDLLELWHWDER